MSFTGTYVYRNGELIKISDNIPKLCCPDVYFKKPYIEPDIDDKPVHFKSKRDKARKLKELGIVEKQGPKINKNPVYFHE